MKKILVINGMAGAGKDTFVSFLKQYFNILHISMVDIAKKAAKDAGWNGEKDEKGRKLLSDIKIAIDEYNDGNFEFVKKVVDKFLNNENYEHYDLLCIDIREPFQIERAVKEFQAITVFVDRKDIPMIMSNIADAGVYDYKYDYIISNNGDLPLLNSLAEGFAKELVNNEKDSEIKNKKNKEAQIERLYNLIKEFYDAITGEVNEW